MISEHDNLEKKLNELTCRCAILKDAVKKCIELRDEYAQINNVNEKNVKRLHHMKEHQQFIKNTMQKDYYWTSINAGKRKILFSHKIEEYQKKNENIMMQLENLPSKTHLKELIKTNESLMTEQIKCIESLENMRKEYAKLQNDVINDLFKKITEFSFQFLQIKQIYKK